MDSRLAGIAAAMLLHLALVVTWQAALRIQAPVQAEPSYTQWVRLPERLPSARETDTGSEVATSRPPPIARAQSSSTVESDAPPAATDDDLQAGAPLSTADDALAANPVHDMIAQAKGEAGAVDRALRKESKPYIVAPPDSPQIRMSKKFREAAALAPNRLWEAPKVVELVNDGGDGARRTRVLTAAGIYCITERSPATSIDMIERHGKQRITNCGHEHEQPVNAQEWRTARDEL